MNKMIKTRETCSCI